MSFELPPVVKLAERLLVDIENAVLGFSRFHKYTFGTDLRRRAMDVATLAHRAWRDRRQQDKWLSELVWSLDDLNLTLQLGSRIRAFASFGQFEHLARVRSSLGKQVGGWSRSRHLNGQNATPGSAPQRAKILSTGAAHRANA